LKKNSFQALVGDKTLAFWLMDKEMYIGMSYLDFPSPIIQVWLLLISIWADQLPENIYLEIIDTNFGLNCLYTSPPKTSFN
jgi:1,4-alpha-glucan branching enzyme